MFFLKCFALEDCRVCWSTDKPVQLVSQCRRTLFNQCFKALKGHFSFPVLRGSFISDMAQTQLKQADKFSLSICSATADTIFSLTPRHSPRRPYPDMSKVTLRVIGETMAMFCVRDDVYGPPDPRGNPTHAKRGEEERRRVVRRSGPSLTELTVCSFLCKRQTLRFYWIKAPTNKLKPCSHTKQQLAKQVT